MLPVNRATRPGGSGQKGTIMKLTRNSVTEANPDLRGQKHHFTIENAPALVLEAMDDMLTAAGWENDTCPLYDEGFSCGWWIDLSDIDEFKADYKAAKSGVKAFMAHQANANPSDVTIVIGEVFTISKGTVIDAVNAFKAWHASEANEGRGGSAYWPRHNYAVVNGEILRISPNGRLWRSKGVEFTDYEGWKPHQFTTVSERNAQVEEPEEFEIIVKGSVGVTNPFNGDVMYVGAVEGMPATVRKMPKVGDVIEAYYWVNKNPERVKVRQILNDCPPRPAYLQAAMDAHHEELFSGFFNDRAKPTEERKRQLEDMSDDKIYAAFAAAHAEALEENDDFDGIIRDGLTDEQRAIHNSRMGIDIYGERFKAMLEADHTEALKMDEEITFVREFESLTHEQAMAYAQQWAYSNADAATQQKMFDHDHDEAFGIGAVRNCAIRDNAKVLKKPVEWRNRQFLWENTWSEEYLAFRLEAAHAEALAINDVFEENLLFLSSPEMADCWQEHSEMLKTLILRKAQTEAIKSNEVYGNTARFEYLNANGCNQLQLVAKAHAEAAEINEAATLANIDVSAPLRIISDYMLRFLRNNKDAKLYEAKDRLERKIVQFVADGFDEQRLRQSLSAATGSHTREAFASAFEVEAI